MPNPQSARATSEMPANTTNQRVDVNGSMATHRYRRHTIASVRADTAIVSPGLVKF